jgi:hypothetical protein
VADLVVTRVTLQPSDATGTEARPSFTVLGASGFLGSHLVRWLQSQALPYQALARQESGVGPPLGHAIYCIGVTADFRRRPYETVRAHVCDLARLLEHGTFDSLLYLSSTGIYAGTPRGHEDAVLQVNPTQPDDLCNISKAMGEALCLSKFTQLAVPLEEMKQNFEKYGLLDDHVRFLPGWFRDTLPTAPIERLSLLRLDGDLYESTIVALRALYPKLAVGGYEIVDDYGAVPACTAAVEDYRAEHAITEPLHQIDWTGVFWQRAHSP